MKLDVLKPILALNGMQLKNTPDEVDADGKVIKEGELMVLADVLVNAAFAPAPRDAPYKPREHVIRYSLALDAYKAKQNGTASIINVAPSVMRMIEENISQIYTPVVAGQVLLLAGMLPEEDDHSAR